MSELGWVAYLSRGSSTNKQTEDRQAVSNEECSLPPGDTALRKLADSNLSIPYLGIMKMQETLHFRHHGDCMHK